MAVTRILHRRGTSAQWAAVNPVLGDGEFGWDKDFKRFKVGDGVTAWLSLPWAGGGEGGGIVQGVQAPLQLDVNGLLSVDLDAVEGVTQQELADAVADKVTDTELSDAIATRASASGFNTHQSDDSAHNIPGQISSAVTGLATQASVNGKADASIVSAHVNSDSAHSIPQQIAAATSGLATQAAVDAKASPQDIVNAIDVLKDNVGTDYDTLNKLALAIEGIEVGGVEFGFGADQAAPGAQVLSADWQPINAKKLGVKGDDVTDDSAALEAAFDGAILAGVTLHIPRGRYKLPNLSYTVNGPLKIKLDPGAHLIGSSGSTAFTIDVGGSLEIEGGEISGFAGHFCTPGQSADGGKVRFSNVWFHDIGSRTVAGGGGVYAGAGGPIEFEMDRCIVEDCYWGIREWSVETPRSAVTNSVFRRVGRSAIRFGVDSTEGTDTVRNVIIHSNYIEDVTNTVDDTSSSSPYNADGIRVTGARDVSIKGNTIVNVYNSGAYSGDNCQAIYTKANGVIIEGNTIRNAGRNAGSIVCKGGKGDGFMIGRGAKVHNNTITVDEDHAHQTAMSSAIRMESWKGSITDNHITGFVQSSSGGIISMQGESNLGAWRDEWVIARNVFYDWGTGTGNCTAIYVQGEKNFTIDANVAMPGGSNGSDDSFIRLVPGANQSQHQKRFAITNNKVFGITKTTSDPDSAKFLHVDYASTNALTSLVVDGNITFDTNMFIDFEISAGGVVNSMTVTNNHCFGLESPAHFVSNGSQAPAMIRMGNFANSVPVDGLRLGNGTVAGSAHFGGTAAPAAGLGSDGDWYWRTTGQAYRKASGSWSEVTFGGGGSWDGGTVTNATTFNAAAGTTFDKGTTGRTVVGGDGQWLSVYKNDTDAHPSIGFGYFAGAPLLMFGDGSATPNLWLGSVNGVLNLIGGTANLPTVRNTPTAKTANYTLAAGDHLAAVRLGNGSGLTLTIPTNATAAVPVGAEIGVQNEGNAMWTIAGAGGVTVRGVLHLGVDQHATLIKTGTNTWFVRGPSHVIVSQAEWDALDGASAFSAGAVYTVGN